MQQPTIYIDTLFFINFIINYLLLLVSARITSAEFKRARLALGACVGALYAVAVVLPPTAFTGHFAIKILAACLMVIASFGFRPGCGLFKLTLVFFGVSFGLAGSVMALYYLFGIGYGSEGVSGILYLHMDAKLLILIAAGAYAVFGLVFRAAAGLSAKQSVIRVKASFLSKEVGFSALVDTGNTLRDPMDHSPVMVAEFDTVRPVLPDELQKAVGRSLLHDPVKAMELVGRLGYGRYFRLIPFKTVGVDCGMLLALRLDSAEVNGVKKDGLLLAMSPGRLSDGAGYSALSGVMP